MMTLCKFFLPVKFTSSSDPGKSKTKTSKFSKLFKHSTPAKEKFPAKLS
jgi:hypothetical protein